MAMNFLQWEGEWERISRQASAAPAPIERAPATVFPLRAVMREEIAVGEL